MTDNKTAQSLQGHTCKSCGYKFSGGLYCNVCGEKVLESKNKTFRSTLHTITQTFTLADNRFIKTLWLVITKPGFVAKEYAEGRRVQYLRPLQLFFILNLIYFLFPLLQLFNTSLHTQFYLRTHSGLVQKMVNAELRVKGYSMQGYTLMYNEKSTNLAKLLIIVFVVLASLPLNLIFRKRGRYFSDHIALSVELASFNLIMNAIFLSLFLMLISKIIHWTHMGWEQYLDDLTLTIIFVLTNLYFLVKAGRTFYGQTGFRLIVKVIACLLGLFVALELYRVILFLVTFWTL
jgi:hypothetical protein